MNAMDMYGAEGFQALGSPLLSSRPGDTTAAASSALWTGRRSTFVDLNATPVRVAGGGAMSPPSYFTFPDASSAPGPQPAVFPLDGGILLPPRIVVPTVDTIGDVNYSSSDDDDDDDDDDSDGSGYDGNSTADGRGFGVGDAAVRSPFASGLAARRKLTAVSLTPLRRPTERDGSSIAPFAASPMMSPVMSPVTGLGSPVLGGRRGTVGSFARGTVGSFAPLQSARGEPSMALRLASGLTLGDPETGPATGRTERSTGTAGTQAFAIRSTKSIGLLLSEVQTQVGGRNTSVGVSVFSRLPTPSAAAALRSPSSAQCSSSCCAHAAPRKPTIVP